MIAVISVYKVANFPDGGGHFWVYMQYAQGLRRLGCDVYWLEQFRPPASGDSAQEAALLAPFFERMKRFGLEGKTLLYAKAGNEFRFVGCEWPDVERVLKRADLLLNFHYAIDPRLLGCARRTALVDIDPGLLQFWISTGQLNVPTHDCYLTTGETVGTPSARFSDCGLPWHRIRPPVCLDLWPFTFDPHAAAFTTVSSWSTTDWLKVTENGKTVLRENTKRVAVQPPGPSAWLPNGEGMFRFTSLDDAAAALDAINRDYGRHCRAARDLAEAQFDSKRVLEGVLNTTLAREMVP